MRELIRDKLLELEEILKQIPEYDPREKTFILIGPNYLSLDQLNAEHPLTHNLDITWSRQDGRFIRPYSK